jgi:hypothetical protein
LASANGQPTFALGHLRHFEARSSFAGCPLYLESGQTADVSLSPLCAISDRTQRSKIRAYGCDNGAALVTARKARTLKPPCWADQRSPCIRLDTMFTVSASTVKLKKNEVTLCTVVSLRIVLLVI